MADPKLRLSSNVPGPYFVDDSCIDCETCRTHAPDFFNRDDEESGLSRVYRQPQTAEEVALVNEAMSGCPTDSIGREPETE